jgi:hypothetical protein
MVPIMPPDVFMIVMTVLVVVIIAGGTFMAVRSYDHPHRSQQDPEHRHAH